MKRSTARTKISTTVAVANYAFLQERVKSGQAASIAAAVDQSIAALRQRVNRARLASATTRYFEGLPARAAAEEQSMAKSLASATKDMDFDNEL